MFEQKEISTMFKMFLMWGTSETISHLFLHCKWTEQLWRMFISLRKINWVKPGSIRGVLNSWNGDGNAATKEERWKIVPACICWSIWAERN